MKQHWTWVVAIIFPTVVEAGLFDRKSDCGENCATSCCQQIVTRPCRRNLMCYQRKVACAPACPPSTCAAPSGCRGFVSIPDSVDGPCGEGSICPQGSEGCDSGGCCAQGCCNAKATREIAQLIHQSMTACYARQRRNAVHHLSDYYDCDCYPQIIDALVYALNDCDEGVRAKAADELGDQIRRNGCCLGPDAICALKYTLGDCDRAVRRQAEQALELCGFRIVDACCHTTGCRLRVSTQGVSVTSETPDADPEASGVPPAQDDIEPMPLPAPGDAPGLDVETEDSATDADSVNDAIPTPDAELPTADAPAVNEAATTDTNDATADDSAPVEESVPADDPVPPMNIPEESSDAENAAGEEDVPAPASGPANVTRDGRYFPSRLHRQYLQPKKSTLASLLGL